ncbi:hypothetical protein JHW45_17095 [Paracoccus stylophorae]|uniref:DUF3828 domain-containing protein n=1 Tax=Paracoccus stylophorae TaxID=659350 RepID=A0ABY7SUK9_9RHOB|nr:hypothetical protein [Paracoccus stylophorae]WCR10725.1 hypothetical protein JHW45_17095 [Paracoccus stylophorae]
MTAHRVGRTAAAAVVWLGCATLAPADEIERFHNNYTFDAAQRFKPAEAEQVAVDPEVLAKALEDYEIAVKKRLAKKKLEISRPDGVLRFVLRWDDYDTTDTTIDMKFKSDQAACFERNDVLRCYVLVSFRKITNPRDRIESRAFSDYQAEYVIDRQEDGSLRPFAVCQQDRCPGVTWK